MTKRAVAVTTKTRTDKLLMSGPLIIIARYIVVVLMRFVPHCQGRVYRRRTRYARRDIKH